MPPNQTSKEGCSDAGSGSGGKDKATGSSSHESKKQKMILWKKTAAEKGYEGAGLIVYTEIDGQNWFIFGINKEGKADYFGGKCEPDDKGITGTVCREVKEETGLVLVEQYLTNRFTVTGGDTGFPSYVFVGCIDVDEYKALTSPDGTFSKFILVKSLLDGGETVLDSNGQVYGLRKSVHKYVLPQIRESMKEFHTLPCLNGL